MSLLEYEQTLRNNETLAENDSVRSVANVIATTSIRQDRTEGLQTRQTELNETRRALDEAVISLGQNPNASTNQTIGAIGANTSITLTEQDYKLFEESVQQRRSTNNETTIASQQNMTEPGNRTVGQRIR